MSIYKRGSTWWVRFTTPSGKLVRQSASTENKQAAQEFHDQLRAESWRIDKLGERPRRTWDEAALKWLQESEKSTIEEDKAKLRWLHPFLRSKYLDSINREQIADLARIKAKQSSPSTANRYLALVRAILRKAAFEWEWIDRVPKVKLYKEAKRRVRWITQEQVRTLLAELPPHQIDVVVFALATGLRQSNVIELEWTEVDMTRGVAWIHGDQAKAGRDIHISLSSVALAVLARQIGKHPQRVFTYKGRPIGWANTKSWRNALKRAGIEDFRWHDLRHTWASWHAQKGTPMNVLQEMGGWETGSMVRRYAHLSPAHLKQHAETVAGMLDDTIPAQSVKEKGVSSSLTP